MKFPMKVRFGEEPTTKFHDSKNNIKVTLKSHPNKDYKYLVYEMVKSTWIDKPFDWDKEIVLPVDLDETFMDVLTFKTLPNSMECLTFVFLIEGLTHIDISHLLRHRNFFSIHAQCSGDRFLTHDSAFIPSSISRSAFKDRYLQLTMGAKKLYQEMVDSQEISLMDARYILTRNHRYFYYVGMNLKDAIAFINQRKCTMIQPEIDNILAHEIYNKIGSIIPEIFEAVSLECGPRCHWIISNDDRNTRLYDPDNNHAKHLGKGRNSLYGKKRTELGIKS